MILQTADGEELFCLPSYAKCDCVDRDVEDMLECPINQFDDFGNICVPELCEHYREWGKEMPFINKPCVSGEVCEHDKMAVLDKIRAEIMDFEEELFHRPNTDYTDYAAVRHCVEIIDKYKAESEE